MKWYLYIGVTSNLPARIWQHRNDVVDGFTHRYGVHGLVWFELHETMESAIGREKTLKEWKRAWEVDLIATRNPYWRDLYQEILGVEARVAGSRRSPGSSDFALMPQYENGNRGSIDPASVAY